MADDKTPPEEPKAEEQPKEETPREEPKQEEPKKAEEPSQEEAKEEPKETPPEPPAEPPQPSPRAAKREENLRLRNLINQLKSQPEAPKLQDRKDALDYGKALDADPEVIQQLEADRKAAEESRFQEGLSQADSLRFHTRLEVDAPKVESKYPFLDPNDKTNFNAGAADAINQWYLATAGYDPQTGKARNPNVRYSDFVEGIMELAGTVSSKKRAESTRNIAKQAANAGLRPGGESVKGLDLSKHPKDMTTEELKEAAKQEAQALSKFRK